jgi:predicted component of type VI protein secretion system
MPFKLIVTETEEILFESSPDVNPVRIGRSDKQGENEVVLPDPIKKMIGRQHAQIHALEERYLLVDVGSKNGTKLNGNPIETGERYPLVKDDIIMIGHVSIRFSPNDPPQVLPQKDADWNEDATMVSPAFREDPMADLFDELSLAYAEGVGVAQAERIASMAALLKNRLSTSDRKDSILDRIEAHFTEASYRE